MTYEEYLLRVIQDHGWHCPHLMTREQFESIYPPVPVRSPEADVMADCAAAVRRAGAKSVPA